MMSLDAAIEAVDRLLNEECGLRASGLAGLAESRGRRTAINAFLKKIDDELVARRQSFKALPRLPEEELVRRAQALLSLPNVAFMEIDTTGVGEHDQVTRFTLLDRQGHVVEDLCIRTDAQLSKEASRVSGVTREMLVAQGISVTEAWPRIQAALVGRYVVSFSNDWDMTQLSKMETLYHLEPVTAISECLWQLAKRYYGEQYYVSLEKCCERIQHALPEHPAQTAIDRARGQIRVLEGFACATQQVAAKQTRQSDDDLEDLDERPF